MPRAITSTPNSPLSLLALFLVAIAVFSAPTNKLVAQGPGDQCVVSILNQTANVRADGSWSIPNIPANMGPVRARVTCIVDGQTLTGTTDFLTITSNRGLG